ncbi:MULTISPECIES: MmoB/DmpM family protein [Pseudomonas]|jgi:phenol hydroxylase P2 protein|uniref:MmoB/DmpM family protein n=1 Tax=Pseudomonas TaxID=286 RepID=UPI0023639696|nr:MULTISPECIES: MmoB/DmpM family protein [Pseudomonas]MDD2101433.1 MmoB/DmpM family protein [Pseudomonas putida]MEB2624654.1 MmoB/DmpM family protein [Pseudomonas sp. YuFO8]
MTSLVYINLQDTDYARSIVEAITTDNPHAVVQHQPSMIRIEASNRLEIRRETVEQITGTPWDIQEMLMYVITLGGNVEEEDDSFSLHWNS